MDNKLAKNIKSPKNEAELVAAYKKINKSASNLNDGLDISIVESKSGEKGIGLMDEKFNRSRDTDFHRVKDFVPMDEIKKQMSNKK